MSAIYQRARPIRWDEVVGQEHVKDVLRAALEQGRVGHAYLFSGPRGVGKTTTARLIAMTANCSGPAPKPCGECESCLAVRAGSHPDVLEIDAASNNSVDDVRDLREKVSLAAMRGGKKIYILDEAHMMSRAAFNALLKTLEEPPSHVIFILATTEPEKIIPTILSRCQHYRFRRLSAEEIAGKLSGLAEKEGVRAEPAALQLIGRLADGAMRDGESLLERMLAAGTAVTRPAVEEALGLPPGERVRSMAAALVLGDAGAALQGAAQLYRDGFAARTVVEGLVAALGAALHAELGLGEAGSAEGGRLEGADVPRLLKLQAALDEQEARFARSADQQSLELALTHALLAADAGAGSAAAPAGAAVTMAAVPTELTQRLNRLEKELASLRAQGLSPGVMPPAAPAGVADFDPAARRGPAPVREVAAQALGQAAGGGAVPTAQGNWADVVRQASIQLKAFLKPARMHAEPGYVSLSYDDKNAFHAKQIAGKFDDVAKLVQRVFGPVTFELIAPEGSRKQTLGGGAGAPAPQAAPAPARAVELVAPQAPAPRRTEPDTAPEVAPFDPTPRRSTARGPAFEPVSGGPGPSGPQASAQGQVSPRPAPQPAGVATLDAPPPRPVMPERRVPPPSPDDVAPAPLPARPSRDSGPSAAAPEARELYVVEAISEEPAWGEIGGQLSDEPPPDLGDSPFAEYVPPRPRPAAPAPSRVEPRPQASAVAPAPGRPADIRAHPMYEHIKGRFSGRVREIGKNRNVVAAPETEVDEGEVEG
ncbi:DNA polymerase III subunit gamma/tau [Deinococcus hohokamensis]|uniref:DNA polymerase III subunit gamma/tau n=1 Tax=Deinococcus hohokamensis TaxID=309883 RepID=A0ABV9IA12_9DEIO